jgi:CRISPR-associated endonuclease/helicase Cas3
MGRGMNKAERLKEMERLYVQRAFSDIEMAERLSTADHRVDRTTVFRDRSELETEAPFIQDVDGRYLIDRVRYLSNIRVNLCEGLSLYLAARRSSQQTHSAQKHTASALEKLALSLKQPMTERLVKAADIILSQKARPEQDKVFEVVADAWAQGLRLRVNYQGLRAQHAYDDVISPYLVEPSPWSDSVYVIGPSDRLTKIVAYKLDRILHAVLTSEQFALPEDFDEQELLRHAWGIWRGEGEPATVKLKFAPGVAARRVQESVWHPLEQVTPTDDGGCVWTAQLAEWHEMLPWVRGWGADVEVLEPAEMRDILVQETRRLTALYGIVQAGIESPVSRVQRLWGKTGSAAWQFHPALFHMLDVGHVAQQLLTSEASPRWRLVLAEALGAEPANLGDWLPWLVALHDIGKISPAFQMLNEEQKTRLKKEGFSFGQWRASQEVHHSLIGHVFVSGKLQSLDASPLPETMRRVWAEAVNGHHGRFYSAADLLQASALIEINEPPEWGALRSEAGDLLREYLLRQAPDDWPQPHNVSAAVMALTGFTILCDWLGSDGRHFAAEPYLSFADYAVVSRRQARAVVSAAGFHEQSRSSAPESFELLFPDLGPARPLQAAIDAIPRDRLAAPCLVIIEAPTGEGKTEAALALAHRLAQAHGSDEMYYALPTTATSNQMFLRLQEHLRTGLGLQASIKLVHSQAFLVEDDLRMQPLKDASPAGRNAALEWFGPRKRSLLAPFGVGTIDQIEMAGLNVRHGALRLVGLAGKVVILDEVHAYDTYMTTIIECVLKWLSALGTSVILLSATLPQARRAALARAYGSEIGLPTEQQAAYPLLCVIGRNGTYHVSPPTGQPERRVGLGVMRLGDEDPWAKAQWLVNSVAGGGCACWIANTVDRAQKIFEALEELCPAGTDCDLLHARLPLDEREAIERAITGKYGRNGPRPEQGIVVGTQVLEQSLDLDFDVMVSDLAPIDLLLQRAGRLHRHVRARPADHAAPYLWINIEADAAGSLKPVVDKLIYAEYFLQQTWLALAGRTELVLPADYRRLVEGVYGPAEPPTGSPLYAAWHDLRKEQALAVQEANWRLLADPDPDWPYCVSATGPQFIEDENSAGWIVARTRLAEESLTVIPLERDGDVARRWPGDEGVRLDAEAPRAKQLELLRRSLRISRREAVEAIRAQCRELPKLFTDSALLKECLPLWLAGGQARLPAGKHTLTIALRPRLGLVIRREGA